MTITEIICLVVVLALAVLGGFFIVKKSKKHDLFKWISLFILLAVALTWIFGYGYFSGTDFQSYGINRLSFTDFGGNLLYYTLNFAFDKFFLLIAIGCFYAVLARCAGYNKLVTNLAKKLKGKEIITIIISSLLFTAMGSLLGQNFVALIFVPFVISVLLAMNLDKLLAFSTTFGGVLIGMLGTTYGGEGAYWFNYYTNTVATDSMLYRLLVLVVAFMLMNFFNILHTKKILKNKTNNEVNVDPFISEKTNNKAKSWPYIIVLALVFVFVILGFVEWEADFNITCFTKFHEWLMGISIGTFPVFSTIIGTLGAKTGFGAWTLYQIGTILLIISLIIGLVARIKLDNLVDTFADGIKKMAKPLGLFIGVYMLMIVVYLCPFIPYITNLLFKNITKLNPFITTFVALIANTFCTDFGFGGFLTASYLTAAFPDSSMLIQLIYTTMYGFVQLFVPTGAILLIGLSYLGISYKEWMKYIWIFAVSLLVILLVLFTVVAYI